MVKVINKLYGGFSFINYENMDEFLIKIEVKSGNKCKINIVMGDYPNLFYLSQKNNYIKFNSTIYSSYYGL